MRQTSETPAAVAPSTLLAGTEGNSSAVAHFLNMSKHKETNMKKLRLTTILLLLLGFGATSSILPMDAHARGKCATNPGTSDIIYGNNDYNREHFGGPPPEGIPVGEDPGEACPGPRVPARDEQKTPIKGTVHINTKSMVNTK